MLKSLLLPTLLLLTYLLASCNDSPTTATSPSTNPAPSPLKVGLLVTGSTSDGGWNQLAKDSLNSFANTHDVQVLLREQVSDKKAADAIRQLEAKGCNLIIAHGYEYLEPAKELSDPAKPNSVKTKIAVSGGDVDNPHFQSLFYDLSGASYQLGILAAKTTKTQKLGFIGGAPFPTVTAMQRGFEAGAKSINPAITVASQYTGWDDPSKSKKQTEAFIQQGIDIIMQNVDAASSGVFEAVKEYNNAPQGGERLIEKVYTFGANSNQNNNPVCPNYTLASAVIRMDEAFARSLKQVQTNTFKGGLIKEDLASGVSIAIVNPNLVGTIINKETLPLLDTAATDLASGKIKIPQ